ncbi:glycosyltransferase [Larsenimonas rhizosphaerae]|uniref:glycosyltransferase n=1 Tax=Larsenimonas rhizosphaerae TaxID=2944682 RepID=UPI002033542C|nr:glycosyltransferase [Larsenimonas rhizosphaerae]MCM2130264.1 glycosyltransferase [Larsenimonas rhizosphaerae]
MTSESVLTPDLSVVVPVYNAIGSLPTLFEHLQALPADRVQILLVNDGSKDDSLATCRGFEKECDNVTVMDQPNGGVSAARNAGLRAARGRYVAFCDSDDYLEAAPLLQVLDKAVDADADVAVFNYATMDESTGQILRRSELEEHGFDFDRDFPMLYEAGLFNPVFNKLFRADLLHRHAIEFEEGVALGEDFRFNLDIFVHVQQGVICNDDVYRYMVGQSESLTTSYNPRQFTYFEYGLGRVEKLLRERGIYSDAFMARHWTRALVNSAQNIAKRGGPALSAAFHEFRDNARTARRQADLGQATPWQAGRQTALMTRLVRHRQDTLLFFIVFFGTKYKQRKVGVR